MEIELHIRPGGSAAEEILEIVDHLTDRWFSPDVAAATRRDLLFHDVLCAKQDGRTRSFLMFTSHDGMLQITLMGTSPDCHRQGFGSALLSRLNRHARDLGFDEIVTFTVPPSSNPAYQSTVEFYQKHGFRIVKKYTDLWRSGAWELRKAVSGGNQQSDRTRPR
jgi:ribosomal protein S18 acetylase RimI-like enzyme